MAGLPFGGVCYLAGNETGTRASWERGFSVHPRSWPPQVRSYAFAFRSCWLGKRPSKTGTLGADLAKYIPVLPRSLPSSLPTAVVHIVNPIRTSGILQCPGALPQVGIWGHCGGDVWRCCPGGFGSPQTPTQQSHLERETQIASRFPEFLIHKSRGDLRICIANRFPVAVQLLSWVKSSF